MKYIKSSAMVLAFVAISGGAAEAAVPLRFTVQGILRDDAGQLQSMPIEVAVRLFDAPAGGTMVAGPYGPTTAMAVNGLFTVAYPDAALPTKLAMTSELWLEVTAGAETFPRQLVTSQFYAMLAAHADEADHATQADGLSSSCNGCVVSAQIKSGDLTHTHAAVLTKTLATTSNVAINALVTICSPGCTAPELVTSGSCTQTGRAKLLEANVDVVNQKYCCRFENDGGIPTTASASALCLAISDTTLP